MTAQAEVKGFGLKAITSAYLSGLAILLWTALALMACGKVGSKEILNPEERQWLIANQDHLVLAVETGYAPFVFLDSEGHPKGLAHEYLLLLESKLGVRFQRRNISTLDDIFAKVRSGEIQVVNAITQTPWRSEFIAFTTPFIRVPNVIVVRKERPGLMGEKELRGLRVSLVRSYAITERLTRKDMSLTPQLVPDDLTGLLDVSFGRSDATVTDLATASYLIQEKGITNLRVAGEADLDIQLSMGTSKHEPILHRILQKGLASISDGEHQAIQRRWINASGASLYADWRFWFATGAMICIVLAVIATILAWNRTLRRQVALRTQELHNEKASLQESEERFRSYVEQSTDVIYTMDALGTFLFVSPAWQRHFGYPLIEVLGKPFAPFVHPEDLQPCLECLNRVMSTGQGETSPPFRVRHADGSWRWFLVNATRMSAPDGQLRFMGVARDITESYRADEKLRASKQQYDDLVTSIPVGVYLIRSKPDETFAFEYASPRMAELFGVELESLRADIQLGFQAVHPDDSEAFVKLNQDGIRHTVPFNWDGRVIVEGAARWLHIGSTPKRMENGDVLWHGVVTDITDRVLKDQALRSSQELLSKAFAVSPDAYAITSLKDGIYLEINEGFTRVLGYTEAEVLGRSSVAELNPLWADRKDREHFVAELKERGEVIDLEATYLKKGGKPVTALTSAKVFEVNGAKNILSITRDITDRRNAEKEKARLQAQLQQAQKMESLGSLAGGVAHDMNNVLGAILGMASANIETQPVGSPAYRAFDTIIKAAERGGKMVKGLLSFARQSPAEEHELDLNAVLREEVRLLERTTLSKVRLEMDLASELRPIRGDASALTHAFMNLCVNAVDAMPEAGTLTLRTRNVDDGWIEVLVEDTGTGMPKEVLERALDPFFTTKEVGKGTGLGLSMVYSTVKAHQGQMEIQSTTGEGTRITMRFPVCESPFRISRPAPEFQSSISIVALSVLLVDDDELILSSMQAILGVLGHSVTQATSGEEALLKLEAGLQPEVVIMDMNMPGLGGPRTLPRIRALRPTLPVLLATGRIDQTVLDLVGAHPFVSLLSKPFTMKELQKQLETIGKG